MSAVRVVTIPSPVMVPIEMTFGVFVRYLVDSDDRFNKTMAGGRAAIRLLAALEKADVGTRAEVHPDDWKLLHEAAEKPSHGYPTLRRDQETIMIPARLLEPLVSALSEESTR